MPGTVYYAAVSADGYIASTDGGVEWLDAFASSELGYDDFFAQIGAVVLGRATYEQGKTFGPWPYVGRAGLVLTSRPISDLPPRVSAVAPADFPAALAHLRTATEQRVWIVGGGKTARACLDAGLLDELEVYSIPRLLGAGIPLFDPAPRLVALRLLESRAFANGVVKMRHAVEQR